MQRMPRFQVWRRRLISVADPDIGPTPNDYGSYVEVTPSIEPWRILRRCLSLRGPRYDMFEGRGRPDAAGDVWNQGEQSLGSAANPVLAADDIVLVRSGVSEHQDDTPNDWQVLFEGFVRTTGFIVGAMGGGRFMDCETVAAEEIATRLDRDRDSQVFGQWRIGPNQQLPFRFITGGPAHDPGLTIFNPGGQGNRHAEAERVTGWGAHPVFTSPGASGSALWTVGDAMTYLFATVNGDERWVRNPDRSIFDPEVDEFGLQQHLQMTVPPSFVVNGLSLVEAMIELARVGRLRLDIELRHASQRGSVPDPVEHVLVLWAEAVGRSRRPLYLQPQGQGLIEVPPGEAHVETVGTNVQLLRYQQDIAAVENAPLGFGDVQRRVLVMPLHGAWSVESNPSPSIDEETYSARYVRSGGQFSHGETDDRNVFRRWTANLSGRLLVDGFGAAVEPGTIPIAVGEEPQIARDRPFGGLPIINTLEGAPDPALQRPVIEWRHTSDPNDYWPLQPANLNLNATSDHLWLAVTDLRSIVHGRTGISFWDACMDRLHAGGHLDVRLIAEVPLDDRLLVRAARAGTSPTQFSVGAVHDQVSIWGARDSAANLPAAYANIQPRDDREALREHVEFMQQRNAAGRGFGSATLLTWDHTWQPGVLISRLSGGRQIDLHRVTSGLLPEVVQVLFECRTLQVELSLGDLRQAAAM